MEIFDVLVCSLADRLFPTFEKLKIQSISVCAFFASAAQMYRNPSKIQHDLRTSSWFGVFK